MGNFVKGEIAKIQSLINTEIPVLFNGNTFDEDAYNKKRAELNIHLIQACVGGEMTEGKKGNGFKFNHTLPTMAEVAELTKLMKSFEDMQAEYLVDDDDDNMEIPEQLQKMDKPRNKKLRQAIVGEGTKALYKLPLTSTDVAELAAMGAEARKAHNTTVALIVAGVVVVVAIGVGVGIYCYNKKKQEEEEADIQAELDDIDVDDIDVDDSEEIDTVDIE